MSTGRIRTFFWCVATLGASLLTVYLGMKAAGYLYYSIGRAGSIIIPHFIVAACAFIAVACFFVLRCGTTKAGGCVAALSHPTLAIAAIICGVASWWLGDPPIHYFLDGFTNRVSMHMKESEAVAWADQIFASPKLPHRPSRDPYPHVSISRDNVPIFLRPLFRGMTPDVIVCYSDSEPTQPYCVMAYVGGGFAGKYGVTIYNTNSVPTGKMRPFSRRCGERMVVWCK